jgi:putative serine protease PepD
VRDGSPAADGGLKTGDVITKVGDTAVTNARELVNAIQAHKPGDKVTITYTRNGTSAQATVTLGDRSEATRSSVSP